MNSCQLLAASLPNLESHNGLQQSLRLLPFKFSAFRLNLVPLDNSSSEKSFYSNSC